MLNKHENILIHVCLLCILYKLRACVRLKTKGFFYSFNFLSKNVSTNTYLGIEVSFSSIFFQQGNGTSLNPKIARLANKL